MKNSSKLKVINNNNIMLFSKEEYQNFFIDTIVAEYHDHTLLIIYWANNICRIDRSLFSFSFNYIYCWLLFRTPCTRSRDICNGAIAYNFNYKRPRVRDGYSVRNSNCMLIQSILDAVINDQWESREGACR